MKSQPAPDADSRSAAESQPATERFIEERLLGQGTMGVVHLVRDRETGELLARKKLLRVDAKSVLRLKREFRALADVSHPNLVQLYEFGRENDIWFLTMEYVPGVDLKAHLERDAERIELTGEGRVGRSKSLHIERVLDAFHQLAAGVTALHRARVLHRDLKPSNVLVAGQRVVVLDFGLARQIDEESVTVTDDGQSAGTPAYMAPEQVRGLTLTEASDWYAFGAMLYEALTGVLPHDGPLLQLLAQKLDSDPTPPIELDAAVPADLNALCLSLLSREPQSRPSGAEILTRLEAARSRLQRAGRSEELRTTLVSAPPRHAAAAPLYGRDQQLRALHAALERVETTNRTLQVHVRGVSGAGKSALVETFLNRIEGARAPGMPQVLVLRSRCYEREAMPFKALDGVVDAISRYFLNLDDIQVSHLLPRDVIVLAKLFPVLERLRAVQRLMVSGRAFHDELGNRQRAEVALRELLERLAARMPVVIWIDDLQWGDLDSAVILKSWLQRTMERPILVLLSYRADEIDTSECLRFVLGSDSEGADDRAKVQVIEVSPLAAKDVLAICRDHLPGLSDQDPLIQRIVHESQGNPFFAAQLAALAHAKLARGTAVVDLVSIDGLIAQTQAFLSTEAQTLLALLALAGRPVAPKLVLHAAQLHAGGREVIHELRRLQLVRSRDVAGERMIEVYHDRVREAVLRALDESQCQRVSAMLLAAASFSGRADPDWLYTLASGAGERAAALRYGIIAADRAQTALAFERAAELYKHCAELCDSDPKLRLELLRKRAAVLGWCGRGALAADVCIEAAKDAPEREALQLLRLATSHLLRSGRFAEGEVMLQRVLSQLGEEVAKTPAGLMRSIVWERLRLTARGGMTFTPRGEDEIPAALLERIDTFDTLRVDSTAMNPMRAYLFLLRSTRWALEAGEPMRVLRALGATCYAEATGGTPRAVRRADQLLRQMAELAQKIGTPQARIEECVNRALTCWLLGRADEVLAPSHEAEQLLSKLGPDEHVADYLSRHATSSARIGALFELAEYGAFADELQSELQRVRAVDNVAAVLQLALNETLLDELLDRRDQVITRLMQQRKQLPPVDFSVFHALHMISVCRAGSLGGQPRWALALLEEDWPRFQRSPMRTAANLALHARYARLHLLVTQHILTSSSVADVPAALRAEIRALSASGSKAAVPILHQNARLALATGDRERAVQLLRHAATYEGPGTHSDRVRYGLGVVMGGQAGAALCAESERALQKRGLSQVSGCLRADLPELFGGEWR